MMTMAITKKPTHKPTAAEASLQAAEPVPAKADPMPEATAEPVLTPDPTPAVNTVPAEKEKTKKKDKEKDKNRDKRKKKEKKNKEAVIIRFDDSQLPLIDGRAEALGLSRAAWVRMVVARALGQD
mgnify:CR=1 FL=1